MRESLRDSHSQGSRAPVRTAARAMRILPEVPWHRGKPKWAVVVTCALILIVCAATVGATCAACVISNPGQATVGQQLSSIPVVTAPPAVTWTFVLALALVSFLIVRPRALSLGRASPAQLQRFLF